MLQVAERQRGAKRMRRARPDALDAWNHNASASAVHVTADPHCPIYRSIFQLHDLLVIRTETSLPLVMYSLMAALADEADTKERHPPGIATCIWEDQGCRFCQQFRVEAAEAPMSIGSFPHESSPEVNMKAPSNFK